MKYRNTKILLLLSLFFFSLSQTFAVMQPQTSYKSYEAFQASGDAPICQVVTDGCNEWTFTDGEKTDPIKLCKLTSDFVYSWSCAEYQDGIMFLQGGADTMYTDPLTTQERALYQTLQAQLTENELTKVSKVTEKYMQFYNTYSKIKQEKFAAKIQTFIQKHIDIRSTGGDISQDRILFLLRYLKLELKIISSAHPIGAMNPLSGEVYSCDGAAYRVYDADYLIDDMMFAVASDEIHVSDGTFLLPNYVAAKEVSTSGTTYIGKNTETQEAYTFSFQSEKMMVYKGSDLIHTCMKQ